MRLREELESLRIQRALRQQNRDVFQLLRRPGVGFEAAAVAAEVAVQTNQIGPFRYDCLVDPNWAAIVAAGGGTEGQIFTTFHGHTFEVHSTLGGAITSALAASGDHYTIAICCDITLAGVIDIGGIDKTIFIAGLVPALGRKTDDSSDADLGSAPVVTAAVNTHMFVQTTGKSGTDRGLVFSNLGLVGRNGKYVFHVDTGSEIDFLHFENCMFGSVSGRMYLTGNELDSLVPMGNLDISVTNCIGMLDAFYENNSTPPDGLTAKDNNLFLTKWWTSTNAAETCLIEGGEYIVVEAQTITAYGNWANWVFKSLKITTGCTGAHFRHSAVDTNHKGVHFSNIVFVSTADATDFGDFQGPGVNQQDNLYILDIHGIVGAGIVPSGTFLTVDSDITNVYVADIHAPDWGTVYDGPSIVPAVPPVAVAYYGNMYAYDVASTITISGTGIANKEQITSFAVNGESVGTTPDHTNDHITIDNAGKYLVTVAMAIESAGGTSYKIGYACYKNNGATLFEALHGHRNMAGGGGEHGSITMSAIIDLSATDTLEVWVWNETNTEDIIVDDISLSVVRIGD